MSRRGRRRAVGAEQVNAYLRAVSGADFTAKDFRTWAGTVLAVGELAACERCQSAAHGKRMINRAVEAVARRLGNTRAVCRKSYIHPAVFEAYLAGRPLRCDEASIVETIRGATIIARCRRAS